MKAKLGTVALALNWDGSRASLRAVPPAARKFLGKTAAVTRAKLAQHFIDDSIREIRICWLPQLRGGDDVLCDPFAAPGGKRVAFHLTRTVQLGDALGVVYRL